MARPFRRSPVMIEYFRRVFHASESLKITTKYI